MAESTALADAVARVGDRWMLLIVQALLTGPRRFGELAADVDGIAPNILSARLRRLEQEGLVLSRPYSRKPLRLAYELTGPGRDLAGALRLLADWASGASEDVDTPRHGACGTPMQARWYCPTCSALVDESVEAGAELRYV